MIQVLLVYLVFWISAKENLMDAINWFKPCISV